MQKQVIFVSLFLLFFCIFLLAIPNIPLVSQVEGFVQTVFSGPRAALFHLNSVSHSDSSEIESLKSENKRLTEKFADYEQLKLDNSALRNQFEDTQISSQKLLPADIVGVRGNITHPDAFVINRGKYDKVDQGMAAIVGHDLIGKIQTVSDKFSIVQLSTSNSFTALGKTLGDNSAGVLYGEGDFLLLDHVVITDKLTKGDLVTVIGDKNNQFKIVQPGIIVGKIDSISKQENQPFQSAKVVPLINYSKLNKVFLIVSQ